MNDQQVSGMLGLAMRAGQLTTGVDLSVRAIRAGGIQLALIDEGAAENAKKRMTDTCAFYHVPLFTLQEGFLDEACGKSGRVAAIIKKGGIAKKIISLLSVAE